MTKKDEDEIKDWRIESRNREEIVTTYRKFVFLCLYLIPENKPEKGAENLKTDRQTDS